MNRPYLFLCYLRLNLAFTKSLRSKILQTWNYVLLFKKTGVDQNKRQETGMKKSPRWRIAIALSALSIIFVSAALAG